MIVVTFTMLVEDPEDAQELHDTLVAREYHTVSFDSLAVVVITESDIPEHAAEALIAEALIAEALIAEGAAPTKFTLLKKALH